MTKNTNKNTWSNTWRGGGKSVKNFHKDMMKYKHQWMEHICSLTASINEEPIILIDPFWNGILSQWKTESEQEWVPFKWCWIYMTTRLLHLISVHNCDTVKAVKWIFIVSLVVKTINVCDRYARFFVLFDWQVRITNAIACSLV